MEGKPQLDVRCPNVMYEIHLVGGGYNFRGIAVPGTPGMIMGFGERLGWSCTALGGDNADLFQEKVNPENPNEYLFKGNWEKFESREETIRVKWGAIRSRFRFFPRAMDRSSTSCSMTSGRGRPLRWR